MVYIVGHTVGLPKASHAIHLPTLFTIISVARSIFFSLDREDEVCHSCIFYWQAPPEQKQIVEVDTAGALETLRLRAVEEGVCGIPTLISVKALPDTSQGSEAVYGIVTSIVNHTPTVLRETKVAKVEKVEKVEKNLVEAKVSATVVKRKTPVKVARNRGPKRRRRT